MPICNHESTGCLLNLDSAIGFTTEAQRKQEVLSENNSPKKSPNKLVKIRTVVFLKGWKSNYHSL